MPRDPRGWLPHDPARIPGNMPVYPPPGGRGPMPSTISPTGEHVLPQPPSGQPIVFPYWLYEMPQSEDWSINSTNFAVAANSTTTVASTYTVGEAKVGVIKSLILTVQNPLATLNLRVRLLVNSAPVQGWSDIYFPAVSATGIILPVNDLVIRLAAKDQVSAQYIEAGGTAYTCSFDAKGWVTPVDTVNAFMRGVQY